MKKIIIVVVLLALIATMFAACRKVEEPVVVEEELITTMKLIVTDTSTNTPTTFIYKVANGFGSTVQGTVQVDTVKLLPNHGYVYMLELLNESASPVEDITTEVLSEKDVHLFLFASDPVSGAGSVTQSGGSFDNNSLPFNQSGRLSTAAGGSGSLTVTLLHEPTNKSGATPADAGGDTDAEAVFPVVLQ